MANKIFLVFEPPKPFEKFLGDNGFLKQLKLVKKPEELKESMRSYAAKWILKTQKDKKRRRVTSANIRL